MAVIENVSASAMASAPVRRLSPLRTFGRISPAVWTIIALLVIWEVGVRVTHTPEFVLPSPSRIAEEFVAYWPRLLVQSTYTVAEILIGFVCSVLIGVPLAVLVTYSRFADRAIYPLIVTSQTVPKVAIAPLMVAWFGYGVTPKIVIVVLLTFFPIVINSVVGLKASSAEMLYLARSMGANSWQTFWKFRLPQAMPNMFAGFKLATVMAVIGAIVAEFVGSDVGLGYVIQVAGSSFNITRQFGAIVMISIIGMIFFMAMEWAEKVIVPWKSSSSAVGEDH
ncbi:NitT/TauT family transport system permease protein [Faunimonas pinastri]|uniref:NitT/TauT family transport system permease protein n=1 Tax=Faunimonas pinastri TaxID=1855383 RepID=A0A1H9EMX3_9HYPH|nr:ABC transporter permease [Faunimonas pinastri]SEQ27106.1 NitT/TauT family transport system permease protein [Faunimonas pinastri]